ncbi:MAG: carbohydrate kinase family protein [Candidatus Pristimantibacillus lignocellulolyticus]|uniref:Carbohydrate kinase family protein n=1 Tax=Candidatus Pristimantibacillus lignocellulolyticus TaxID=2994561 RepID=A0A9J6ZDZ9_9BACL|nr:MAG: carbohydrate kinase family protein [Candidatus Pristimantibacillus lignocellulolyticus]
MSKIPVLYPVIVGGHICLDIIPTIKGEEFEIVPGKLMDIGKAVLATGGAVANTGLALHRLGIPVQLMGKVGEDFIGETIISIFKKIETSLANNMIIAQGEYTSYSIVISPQNMDRMFLHFTGANDTFHSNDIKFETLLQAGLFHFGYPPLMRQMYENNGTEIINLMSKAKEAGNTTSLDLATPDPDTFSGQLDWFEILTNLLPCVDLFFPSLEEILFMVQREKYEEMQLKYGSEHLINHVDAPLLYELSNILLTMGAPIVVIKLGEYGLYMRTTANRARLQQCGRYAYENIEYWYNRELYIPCFKVNVVGTTGAGDCTIAGFIAGFIQKFNPEHVMINAVATGACNVEQSDATSGIIHSNELNSRIAAGWEQSHKKLQLTGYIPSFHNEVIVYLGTRDQYYS